MKIVNGYPPNFPDIVSAFPNARRKGVIFTYGELIYAPGAVKLTPALVAHEKVHSVRQAEIGVEEWWRRYIESPDFRFHEELLAHQAEYAWFRLHRPNKAGKWLEIISQRLSGDLYGHMVTTKEARNLILEQRVNS